MSDCHTGGSFSMAEIMAALYFHVLRVDPANPEWEGRDYVVLSKGHTVPALDAALALRGFFPVAELVSHLQLDSRLGGHACTKVPGIEVSTGSLGHGLSIAVGAALGLKSDGKPNRVFVLLGDGELQEGSNWEAAMSAAHFGLDNLTAIVDRNVYQAAQPTEEVMAIEPLVEKFRSFGFSVRDIAGHDMEEVVAALERVPYEPAKPSAIVARTVKGKGVSFVEEGHSHMFRFDAESRAKALAELAEGGR